MLFSVFPEGGAVHGVGTGLQPPSMVPFKVISPQSTNGHLVEVTELEQELDRSGAAAGHCCVVSNTPVLPLGVWTTNNTHLMKPGSHTAPIVYQHCGHFLTKMKRCTYYLFIIQVVEMVKGFRRLIVVGPHSSEIIPIRHFKH